MLKPILFNTEMVRAILDGRKTVTRRVVKQRVDSILSSECRLKLSDVPDHEIIEKLCAARYEVGDILYVRETWCWCPCWDCGMDTENGCCDDTADRFYNDQRKEYGCYGYKASFETGEQPFDKWHPSIHMPKEAARLFLRVTGVRAERLEDITVEQCEKEGMTEKQKSVLDKEEYWYWFKELWDSTIKPADLDCYGWNANPWVWVIEFERCERPCLT